ncbi:MAG: sigma-70 family RNA polymerase sigma factor [Anaerolineae bacterium]|nr:sigma-70 family RNA polymerase sigma factor [Anaerolineae bacterium]
MTQVELQALTLSKIRHRCTQESNRFFSRQDYDPWFCYELFRRAILQRDDRAWDAIYAQYEPLVSHWVAHHAAFAGSGEEDQFFMNRAFEKMWVGITPEKFEMFPDLKSLLRYLQMCVHSVMVDFVRQKEYRLVLEPMEDLSYQLHGEETAVEDQIAYHGSRKELWDWLKQQLNHEKETAVVYGMFVLALKPRDMLAQYPGVFEDVKDVYRVKENLVARLRRSDEFRQFWDDA